MIDHALISHLAPTGALRAVINLGNPVLAQGDPDHLQGVSVAIARRLAQWLGVALELVAVDAARAACLVIVDGRVDVCFLAIEPAREESIVFTAPYVVIEGVYVTDSDSPLATSAEVDREGVRVGVREGSAYDLFLTRTLEHAEIVRAAEATDVFEEQGLDAAAGVRQPLMADVAETGRRILEPAFMQINQAVGLPRATSGQAVAQVAAFVEELKSSGFIREELARSGVEASVAPLVVS
ncbi:MAG: transporter substrate-binding domain-containing protein [Tetrasphaera sp.]